MRFTRTGKAGWYLAASLLVAAAAVPALIWHASEAQAAEKKFYTCSMHPMVIQEEPGDCPICGMALVPKKPAPLPDETGQGHDHIAAPAEVGTAAGAEGKKVKYWVAPMDPTYISDKPGKSPMGMDLVPVYEDGAAKESSSGTVTVDPVVVQNMGVRVAPAERGTIFRHVRTIGEVEVAEDEISVVNLRYSGWIERIFADETGQKVKQGERLFEIYSPELVTAQEEFLLAVGTSGRDSKLARSAARRLSYWDIPERMLDEIVKAGTTRRTLVVRAPRAGYVLHKNVVEGARVTAGKDLYRIGDLKKIWIKAQVYEADAPWIAVGQRATLELSFQKGRTWEGKVSYVYPTLNPRSRTLEVRLEFPNPGLRLKPAMFATVRIEAQRKDDVLHIPTEAILHSGERQLVFVTQGYGKYQARELVTGLVGDRHHTEVISGLDEGETVVTSGQFLLDSESQLQEAVQKLLEARLQAKQKRTAAESGAGDPADHDHGAADEHGESYWTCSMHPQVVQDGPGTCPMCGMDLVERKK